MKLQLSKSVFSLILLVISCPLLNAQNYSEDITDASSGIIEAVSEHNGSIPNLAEYAFDEDTILRGWANQDGADFPAWISYEFPEDVGPKNVVAYSFFCSENQTNSWSSIFLPVRWTVKGENSDGIFLLDSVEFAVVKLNAWQTFELENDQTFDKYIFTFHETEGMTRHTFMTEMELYEPKIVSSISKVVSQTSIDVFPNPTSETLTIKTLNEGVYNISLINPIGQEVFSLQDASIGKELQINCADFSQGMYTLLLQNEKDIMTKQIIIE